MSGQWLVVAVYLATMTPGKCITPSQGQGSNHLCSCDVGVQGLGKTVQAIGIAVCFQEDWPLLIVCPKSLRLQWLQAPPPPPPPPGGCLFYPVHIETQRG